MDAIFNFPIVINQKEFANFGFVFKIFTYKI